MLFRLAVMLSAALASSCATPPSFDQLLPINPLDEPELRVRQEDVMTGFVRAYVVRSGSVTVYQERRSGHAMRIVITPATDRILGAAAGLAQYDQQSFSCGIVDGDIIQVEGVLDGRHFALSAATPFLCQYQNAGSRDAFQVLHLIDEVVG